MRSMSSASNPPVPPPIEDRLSDECSEMELTETGETDGKPLIDARQHQDSHTRQLLKQEKKEEKKRRNKRVRKRIRRVLRTSWKWFRRGCQGLAPFANGLTMAFGPVVKPYPADPNNPTLYDTGL